MQVFPGVVSAVFHLLFSGLFLTRPASLSRFPTLGVLRTHRLFKLVSLCRMGNSYHAINTLRERQPPKVGNPMLSDNHTRAAPWYGNWATQCCDNTAFATCHGGQRDDG